MGEEHIRRNAQRIKQLLEKEVTSVVSRPSRGREEKHARIENHFDVIVYFELLSSLVYKLRKVSSSGSRHLAKLEEYIGTTAIRLHALGGVPSSKEGYSGWIGRYRAIWRQNFSLFAFTVVLFLGAGVIGWHIGMYRPEYVPLLVPQPIMENILDHDAWFESLAENPIVGGLQIALNNIMVCIRCFLGGVLLGLGGFVVLVFNGLMLGGVLGYCALNGFHDALLQFVVGHGILELSIIVASAFASFIFGRVFFMRPYRLLPGRFRIAAGQAGTLAMGIIPWLVLAAIIEAGLSPLPFVPFSVKFGVGTTVGAMFWGWTFWPAREGAGETSPPSLR
jgi:uncharacterized membrane protein SpoIIM required for sporulation